MTNTQFSPPSAYNGTQSWLTSLDYWIYQNGLPPNYRDHYEMLSDYFDKAVSILKQWDGGGRSDQDYRMAMLFGLNTNDFLALPVGNPGSLSTEYNSILAKYGITQSMLDTFWKSQLTNSSDKLPNNCP